MKWRYYAEREFPRVVRELGLPAATSKHDGLTVCPRHRLSIGPVGQICLGCHDEAWDEISRRYRDADQGARGST
jgi:hypothetical protein